MNRYLSFGAALVSQRSGHKFEMPRVEVVSWVRPSTGVPDR